MTESESLPTASASGEVVRREPGQVALDGLRNFQDLILTRLGGLGLPTEDVLVALNQRHALLQTTEHALAGLDDEQRARSAYIAKMIMAGSVGLFDAALNYLWDETVIELRKRVIGYDLSYFYAVAEKSENRRKELKTADDLVKLDDSKLLSGAREIGLISDVGYHQVDHIRFMRNYASAAHPNQVSLTGLQLADWLETCIREVITLPHNNVVAEIKKLVVNVQAVRLDSTYLAQTAVFFKELPTEKADTLAIGLFGVYTTIGAEPHTLDNIRDLWPKLWPYISDDTRFWAGTRLGRFLADADHAQAVLARQLIDLAQGSSYLPEAVKVTELAEAIEELMDVHLAVNNFYNEPRVARRLAELVGQHGSVPANLVRQYVKTLVTVFLTNGNGEVFAADPIYLDLIGRFDPHQASLALRSFANAEISSQLQRPLSRTKWDELLNVLDVKITGRPERELLQAVREFPGTPDKLRLASSIKRYLDAVPR
ncbi:MULTISPECIES: hypothetical protein [unclassified Streptomyces]|uniref:hypothetical protein n=1 Tax=unclassified Streptomyces TaxID=2593676 RepID=UPI002DDBD07B|nr:hypothetical protein [Streptomyces sp. NBC_01795]WSA97761.1 hypothetical protein OIE63_40455 [Streptomyces sp. NBC_01795]WSS46722.1 hypothetical protein OG220_39765 [Streptomyces sp. NBC_01187]WSS47061.1 hypothetical protein OG220_41860 [Streptomyces sp. NBC_01187]